mmetsp:Transcript_49229/g.130729  ORF Transcript_49229/g.130729 Transcript_49229/m.130729 type:complete len:703 (-) Transcript_49229:550-2658(-)
MFTCNPESCLRCQLRSTALPIVRFLPLDQNSSSHDARNQEPVGDQGPTERIVPPLEALLDADARRVPVDEKQVASEGPDRHDLGQHRLFLEEEEVDHGSHEAHRYCHHKEQDRNFVPGAPLDAASIAPVRDPPGDLAVEYLQRAHQPHGCIREVLWQARHDLLCRNRDVAQARHEAGQQHEGYHDDVGCQGVQVEPQRVAPEAADDECGVEQRREHVEPRQAEQGVMRLAVASHAARHRALGCARGRGDPLGVLRVGCSQEELHGALVPALALGHRCRHALGHLALGEPEPVLLGALAVLAHVGGVPALGLRGVACPVVLRDSAVLDPAHRVQRLAPPDAVCAHEHGRVIAVHAEQPRVEEGGIGVRERIAALRHEPGGPEVLWRLHIRHPVGVGVICVRALGVLLFPLLEEERQRGGEEHRVWLHVVVEDGGVLPPGAHVVEGVVDVSGLGVVHPRFQPRDVTHSGHARDGVGVLDVAHSAVRPWNTSLSVRRFRQYLVRLLVLERLTLAVAIRGDGVHAVARHAGHAVWVAPGRVLGHQILRELPYVPGQLDQLVVVLWLWPIGTWFLAHLSEVGLEVTVVADVDVQFRRWIVHLQHLRERLHRLLGGLRVVAQKNINIRPSPLGKRGLHLIHRLRPAHNDLPVKLREAQSEGLADDLHDHEAPEPEELPASDRLETRLALAFDRKISVEEANRLQVRYP